MTTTMADTILYGGNIITMEESKPGSPEAEAIAISGQTISAVGSVESVFRYKGSETQVIFLKNQTLMPGFIEPHQHAIMCALTRSQYVNISGLNYRSYSEIQNVMTAEMQKLTATPNNQNWGLFFAWDPELVPDLPTLSADYLDANYSKDIPMAIIGQSGHVAWVNHKALEIAGITDETPSPPGGTFVKDDQNKLTGQLFEEPAMGSVLLCAPPTTEEEIKEAVKAQWKYYSSVGLTTVTDLGYMPNPGVDQIVKTIADNKECPIRLGLYKITHAEREQSSKRNQAKQRPLVLCCPRISPVLLKAKASDAEGGIGSYSSKLWEAGLKIIADGSPHCGTAAVNEPFLHMPLSETLGFPPAPGYGILNCETQALFDTVKKYHLQGKQIAIHCHGERASEQAVKMYEQVLGQCEDKDNRHRMDHCGLMTVEQIARAGKINLALSFFVDHLRFYGLIYKTDIFGDRVNRWTPLSEATKSGVTWTIHQDHPTFPGDADPLANMKTAVTRCTRDDRNTPYGPEYRVSIHEALKAYTVNAAWQIHRDDLGSIAVGKQADLVVLSENPYKVDPFDLERIEVVETFLDGHRNNLAKLETVTGKDGVILKKP